METKQDIRWMNADPKKCGCCGDGWFDDAFAPAINWVACPHHFDASKPNPHDNPEHFDITLR